MTKTLSEYVEGLSHETLSQCIEEYERWYQNGGYPRYFTEDSKLIQCAKDYYGIGYDGCEWLAVIRQIHRRCALMWAMFGK